MEEIKRHAHEWLVALNRAQGLLITGLIAVVVFFGVRLINKLDAVGAATDANQEQIAVLIALQQSQVRDNNRDHDRYDRHLERVHLEEP